LVGRALVVDRKAEPRLEAIVPSSITVSPGRDCGHQPGESGSLLAVEIALQPVTDGLMQHHAGQPAPRPIHFAGRRRHDSRLTSASRIRAVGSSRQAWLDERA